MAYFSVLKWVFWRFDRAVDLKDGSEHHTEIVV